LEDIAKIPPERVAPEATIEDDLKMESIAFLELQVTIEDEFHIELDPIEIVERNRFDSIVDYIIETIEASRA
jgi:acyl carrier protein